jgi:hypothetical protein
VCSVDAEQVRPFWGRAVVFFGGAFLAAALVAGAAVFATLRGIGYEIGPRQVFWPPAWGELSRARIELFVRQAEGHLKEGRVREAVRALTVANQLAPNDYRSAMLLAQLYRAGNPMAADRIYLRMSQQHPARRNETARVWFTSMLAQGRLDDIAQLARRQLMTDQAHASVWLHALLFASRLLNRYELVEAVALDAKVPAAARAVARLEVDFRRAPDGGMASRLRNEVFPVDFPYARLHRAQLLVESGHAGDALRILSASKDVVAGRDLIAAALSAMAAARDDASRSREIQALLGPRAGDAEVELVAVHLVRHPDVRLAEMLVGRWSQLPSSLDPARHESTLAVLCAAGAAVFERVRRPAVDARNISPGAADRLEQLFFASAGRPRVESVLVTLTVLPLDLNFAMLERSRR